MKLHRRPPASSPLVPRTSVPGAGRRCQTGPKKAMFRPVFGIVVRGAPKDRDAPALSNERLVILDIQGW